MVLGGFIVLLLVLGLLFHVLAGGHSPLDRHLLPPVQRGGLHSLFLDVVPACCDLSLAEMVVCLLWVGALVALTQFKMVDITGRMAAFALATAVLPVTRKSVWVKVIGLSFERAIKFHRWVSRLAVLLALVHGVLQVVNKGSHVLLETRATSWGWGNIYGTLSLGVMLFVSLLAIGPIRRRYFEAFYYPHFLALAAVGLAMAHAKAVVWVMLPPLALYALDKALQWGSACCTSYRITQLAKVSGGCRVVVASTDGRPIRFSGGQYFFLRIPCVSRLQAHPFSAASAPSDGTVTFIVKDMGPGTWTGALTALAGACDLAVKLDGPYGSLMTRPLNTYRVVYLIGGGIGVTPMVSLGLELRDQPSIEGRRVHFIWTNRDAQAESSWFPYEIQAMRSHPNFDVQIYSTSQGKKANEMGSYLEYSKSLSSSQFPAPTPCPTLEPWASPCGSGRPDWTAMLAAYSGQGVDVAVCVCGPESLQVEVQAVAQRYGYHWHKETFAL